MRDKGCNNEDVHHAHCSLILSSNSNSTLESRTTPSLWLRVNRVMGKTSGFCKWFMSVNKRHVTNFILFQKDSQSHSVIFPSIPLSIIGILHLSVVETISELFTIPLWNTTYQIFVYGKSRGFRKWFISVNKRHETYFILFQKDSQSDDMTF